MLQTTPPTTTPTLLLTGATGLVGSQWLPLLQSARPGRRIAVLSRSSRPIPGVIIIPGDLRYDLDLDSLCGYITEIIHCAADIRFTLPIEEARAVNTEGTRRLLDFARRCPKLERFAHLSTIYVAGKLKGQLREQPLENPDGFMNTYQQSKYEAEQLVLAAMRDVPAAIFRLGSIVGDSTNGRVEQFNYFHQLLRMIPRNVLPMIPGDPEARIDMISSDWAVPALAFLYEARFKTGSIFNICAGSTHSMSVGEMLARTFKVFEGHPACARFQPLTVPQLVSHSEFERYSSQLQSGTATEFIRVLAQFLPHIAIRQSFDNTNTLAALNGSGLTLPNVRDYYSKVVLYCLDTGWGRATS